jgi:hypothetical protein
MKVGDSWTADWNDPRHQGNQTSAHFHKTYKVVGWEDVTVPAGTFHALKIEENGIGDGQITTPAMAGSGVVGAPGTATTVTHVQASRRGVVHITTYAAIYYAPEVKHAVKSTEEQYNTSNVMIGRQTEELVSYKAGS